MLHYLCRIPPSQFNVRPEGPNDSEVSFHSDRVILTTYSLEDTRVKHIRFTLQDGKGLWECYL